MTVRRPLLRRPARHLTRLTVVALLTAIAAIGTAAPASAHNVLLSSNPADGAVLQAGPPTVQLTFDQPVQNFQPVVTVLGPDGQRYESGAPQVDSTVVTASVGALPGAGDYVIAYRVVSADGHPVQGEIRFRLDASAPSGQQVRGVPGSAGASSAAAPSAPSLSAPSLSAPSSSAPAVPTTAAVAPASSSSGLSGWVWAAIALAAVLVAAAVVVIARRPRSDQL